MARFRVRKAAQGWELERNDQTREDTWRVLFTWGNEQAALDHLAYCRGEIIKEEWLKRNKARDKAERAALKARRVS